MGDHEVCITRREEEEEEGGGRTASEVRDWHPTSIPPVFVVRQSGLGMELLGGSAGWKTEIVQSVSVLGSSDL